MRSSNPIFRNDTFENVYQLQEAPMTVVGTVNKLLVMSLCLIAAAAAVFYQYSLKHFDYVNILTWTGLVVGFVLAIVISFKKNTAKFLAPIYAFAEGACLSGISCFFEAQFPGIVIQAISITMLTLFSMAILYRSQIIRATDNFKKTLFTATLAIGVFYLISFILMLFKVNIPYFTSTSNLAIGINVLIALVAAFNLILDFDFIEKGEQHALPSDYEWYGAFGLMVTLVWLYVEVLRQLARLRDR